MIDATDLHYGDPEKDAGATCAAVEDWLRDSATSRSFVLAFSGSEPVALATVGLLHPGAALQRMLYLKDVFVAEAWRGRRIGEPIAPCYRLVVHDPILPARLAPGIPVRDLLLAERQQIPDQVDANEPATGRVAVPEARRIDSPRPDPTPRLLGGDETAGGQVRRIEVDREVSPMGFIELGVHRGPAFLIGLPELADPVILMETRCEVGRETAAHVQHCTEQQREVATDLDGAFE